jgi:hypothetical protein
MALELWMVTALANLIMVIIYGLIAIEMVVAIIKGRQLLSNPLLTATAAVFVTCTFGHGMHLEHSVLAAAGVWGESGVATGLAVRETFSDPTLIVWDVFTALVAIYFYTLRSRFAVVYRGAALNEDLAKREAQAMELHDNVVQGLVQAKYHLNVGNRAEAERVVAATLGSSRSIITNLLGKEGSEIALGPGDLRRMEPAGEKR